MKIWNTTKLDSVLERCDVPASAPPKQAQNIQAAPVPFTNQRCLTRLLASERLHGNSDRDPTQKRHDFRYFSKHSFFVLVEDVKQELATIHALEYPISKGKDGKERGAWPVLYCHPNSRGPFIEFDEREKRRWEKGRRAEEDRDHERQQKAARELQQKKRAAAWLVSRKPDLRRSVSMNNLHRQVTNDCVEEHVELEDTQPSANASGYLASTCTGTYVAASGNSVAIASATGTTSTVGRSLRTLDLPASLRGRMQQQIVTSRKVSSLVAKGTQNREPKAMGPPDGIPERALLRKSRSTNTLKLPKRDEGTKPGYCESCRVKFDDFDIVSPMTTFQHLLIPLSSTYEIENIASLLRTTLTIYNWISYSVGSGAVLDSSSRRSDSPTRRAICYIIARMTRKGLFCQTLSTVRDISLAGTLRRLLQMTCLTRGTKIQQQLKYIISLAFVSLHMYHNQHSQHWQYDVNMQLPLIYAISSERSETSQCVANEYISSE